MLKFGGFRATIKFGNKDKGKKGEDAQPVASGIYRSYKEEFYGNFYFNIINVWVYFEGFFIIIKLQLKISM